MLKNAPLSSSPGFTLLEVLFALAILAIALLGFHQGQSNSIRLTLESERRLQATELAQMKMTEVEAEVKKKGFQGLRDEEKGEFKDERFKDYKWSRKFEKTEPDCFMPSGEKKDSSGNSSQQDQGQSALPILKQVFDTAIRKMTVTVEWQEGKRARSVDLSQLYIRFEDIPSPP